MASLQERFEAKVDRTGDHHLWTGAKKADGTGKLKIDGKAVTAQRVAWELEHGQLPPGVHVRACPENKSCVRVDHLSLQGQAVEASSRSGRQRSPRGAGSKREIRPGVWELSVTRGVWADGKPRREYSTVRADDEGEASRALAAFVAELDRAPLPDTKDDRDIKVDQAVKQYVEEHLRDEMGREERTIRGYQQVHDQWFSPEIGQWRLRDVDKPAIDRRFGRMRQAGLSRSRMNEAKSLYTGLFRWAKERRFIRHLPLTKDYPLPKSQQVPRERVPPEVDQLCLYLATAVDVVPEIAPILVLDATTGMRLGELVTPRRNHLDRIRLELRLEKAADIDGTLKNLKNDTERTVTLYHETVDMLLRHCERMDERAADHGVEIAPDAFIFSLEPDCSQHLPPGYVTKKVQVLKEHLGIADKRPDVIQREDEALRLFSSKRVARPAGRRGPKPKGAMSYEEIGRRLDRSGHWVAKAIQSAQRREAAGVRGDIEVFDGSVLALRKFTSSELLDAGFNIKVVATRQGHGPEVLAKHYAKRRRSADRKAAEHLGRLVHRSHEPKIGHDAPSL